MLLGVSAPPRFVNARRRCYAVIIAVTVVRYATSS